jgi:hypothetical protein
MPGVSERAYERSHCRRWNRLSWATPYRETVRGRVHVKSGVRPRSIAKVPLGCMAIPGDALDARSYQDQVAAGSTFVHLVGVSHPAPWKAAEFETIDLASLKQSIAAAKRAAAGRFVFVSVAHPAPVMKAYIEVRMQCEQIVRRSGLNATILRPWYILGPGHRWPYVLIPLYKALEAIPATRESAVRLGAGDAPANGKRAGFGSRVECPRSPRRRHGGDSGYGFGGCKVACHAGITAIQNSSLAYQRAKVDSGRSRLRTRSWPMPWWKAQERRKPCPAGRRKRRLR